MPTRLPPKNPELHRYARTKKLRTHSTWLQLIPRTITTRRSIIPPNAEFIPSPPMKDSRKNYQRDNDNNQRRDAKTQGSPAIVLLLIIVLVYRRISRVIWRIAICVARCYCFEGRDGFVVGIVVLWLETGWETCFWVADVEVVGWWWAGWVLIYLLVFNGYFSGPESGTYVCKWIWWVEWL